MEGTSREMRKRREELRFEGDVVKKEVEEEEEASDPDMFGLTEMFGGETDEEEDEEEVEKKVKVRVRVQVKSTKRKKTEGGRNRRSLMTDEEIAKVRAREAESKRTKRALMTEEEVAEKRAREAANKRRRRALMKEKKLAEKSTKERGKRATITDEEVTETRSKEAANKRKKRTSMTEEEVAEKRARDAANKRKRRALLSGKEISEGQPEKVTKGRRSKALMTEEELKEKRARDAANKRRRRALKSGKEVAEKSVKGRRRKALMTEEELAEYRAKQAADKRRRRALKSGKEVTEGRTRAAPGEGRRRRKALMTEEELAEIKADKKARTRWNILEKSIMKRANETEDEKKARLDNYRQVYQRKRATETEAEKKARLKKRREYVKQLRSKMTPAELEEQRQRKNQSAKNYHQKQRQKIFSRRLHLMRLNGGNSGGRERCEKINIIMDLTGLPRGEAQRLLLASNPELKYSQGNTRSNEGPFICEYCCKQYKSKSSLDKHVKLVHLGIRVDCDLCVKSFRNETALWKHKVSHHKLDLDPVQAGVPGNPELCLHCGEMILRNMAGHLLKYHQDIAPDAILQAQKERDRRRTAEYRKRNREQFNANVREYLKRKRERLAAELANIPEPEPEVCPICDTTFLTGEKLTWHLLTDHYNEIQFNVDRIGCYFCGESQTEANVYRLHVVFQHSQDLLAFVQAQIINGNVKKVPNSWARNQPMLQKQRNFLPKSRTCRKAVEEKANPPIQEVSASDCRQDEEGNFANQDDHFEDGGFSPPAEPLSPDCSDDDEMSTSGPAPMLEIPTPFKSYQFQPRMEISGPNPPAVNNWEVDGNYLSHSTPIKHDIHEEEFESVKLPRNRKVTNRQTRESAAITPNTSEFICEYCSKRYRLASLLDTHIRKVHIQTATKCDICAAKFPSAIFLWKHKVNFHNLNLDPSEAGVREKQELCPYCGDTVFRIKSHVKKKHASKFADFQSRYKPRKVISQKELDHRRNLRLKRNEAKGKLTVGKKEQPCPYCGATFFAGSGLSSHVRKLHPEKVESFFNLMVEEGQSRNQSMLENQGLTDLNHQYANPDLPQPTEIVKGPTPAELKLKYVCPAEKCKNRLINPKVLFLHYMRVHCHPEVTDPNKNTKDVNQYACKYCERTFGNYSTLRNHVKKIHKIMPTLKRGEKPKQFKYPFPCKSCPQQFMEKALFEDHVKKFHLGVKHRSVCDLCSRRFGCKAELWRHKVDIHKLDLDPSQVGVKKIKDPKLCPYCGMYVFINLKNHVRSKHPDKFEDFENEAKNQEEQRKQINFKCHVCDISFRDEAKLDFHMRRKHPEEVIGDGPDPRLSCDICGERVWTERLLTLHLFAKHDTNLNMDPDDDNNLSCKFCGESQPEAVVYELHVVHAHSQELIGFVRDEISNGNIIPGPKGRKKSRKLRYIPVKKMKEKKRQQKISVSRKLPKLSRKETKILGKFPEIDWKFPLLILDRVDETEAIAKVKVKPKIGDQTEETGMPLTEKCEDAKVDVPVASLQQCVEGSESNLPEDDNGQESIDFPEVNVQEVESDDDGDNELESLNTPKPKFNCDECEESYKTQEDLRYHQMIKHPVKF